jgi:hypothetical protein
LIEAIPPTPTPNSGPAAAILTETYDAYDGDAPGQERLAHFASARLGPVLQRLTWSATAGEKPNDALLRAELISVLGKFGDAEVVAEANRRYSSGDPSATGGPLRTTILEVVARHVDYPAGNVSMYQAVAKEARWCAASFTNLSAPRAIRPWRNVLSISPSPPNPVLLRAARSSAPSPVCIGPRLRFCHPEPRKSRPLSTFLRARAICLASPSFSRHRDDRQAGRLRPTLHDPKSRKSADVTISMIRDRIRVPRNSPPDITQWLQTHGKQNSDLVPKLHLGTRYLRSSASSRPPSPVSSLQQPATSTTATPSLFARAGSP